MENLRKELIDFYKWLFRENPFIKEEKIEKEVDIYLSINSKPKENNVCKYQDIYGICFHVEMTHEGCNFKNQSICKCYEASDTIFLCE